MHRKFDIAWKRDMQDTANPILAQKTDNSIPNNQPRDLPKPLQMGKMDRMIPVKPAFKISSACYRLINDGESKISIHMDLIIQTAKYSNYIIFYNI